jgi:hypothetical protein
MIQKIVLEINANIPANKLKICNAGIEGQAKDFSGTYSTFM